MQFQPLKWIMNGFIVMRLVRRKQIALCTIILILFQSFSAVANLLDFHTIDKTHLQTEHQQSVDVLHVDQVLLTSDDNSSTNYHTPIDCHHCGHCHGTHAQWVSPLKLHNVSVVQQLHQFFYLKTIIDGPVSQLLRPPKL